MIHYLILGFLLATIGMTVLNCIGEIISAITELIKALISVGIMSCNAKINKLTPQEEESKTRAIGFAINSIEEDEDE